MDLDALGHCENKSVPPPPRSFMEKSKFKTVRRSEEKKPPPLFSSLHFIYHTSFHFQSLENYGRAKVFLHKLGYSLVELESWRRSFFILVN